MFAEASQGATPALTHRQILLILSGLMLGMLLSALDQTILASALPTIVGDLGGLDHLSWVITAYLLTSTTSVPLYGKISDLYGRKQLFLLAILVFLAGSALSGAAQSMLQLIVFRGLQGLGAGGIMSLSQAIIADIVSPRERGRYIGYFGVVFAMASIGGPLLGGFFTDDLSWRWVFFLNLPLGGLALFVTARYLHLHNRPVKRPIDYGGAALIIAATTCLLLATTWGGTEYAWGSATIVGLFAATAVLGGAFVLNELTTEEPLLPLRLFSDRIFNVANLISMIVGLSMFGTIAFLPVYMQVVRGTSATESGLRTVPFMLGVVTTSIASGRMISKTGRYRIYPILGTAIMAVSLLLFSRLHSHSSWLEVSLVILAAGVGMGLIMQVMLIAVQNSVPQRDLGTATAAVTFFRSMGGALGVAIFGAIVNNRLNVNLQRLVPAEQLGAINPASLRAGPEQLRALPDDVHRGVVEAFSRSLDSAFLWAVPAALLAFGLTWLLREIPLRRHAGALEPEAEEAPVLLEV